MGDIQCQLSKLVRSLRVNRTMKLSQYSSARDQCLCQHRQPQGALHLYGGLPQHRPSKNQVTFSNHFHKNFRCIFQKTCTQPQHCLLCPLLSRKPTLTQISSCSFRLFHHLNLPLLNRDTELHGKFSMEKFNDSICFCEIKICQQFGWICVTYYMNQQKERVLFQRTVSFN